MAKKAFDIERAKQLRAEGYSNMKIAKILGFNESCVRKNFKKIGLNGMGVSPPPINYNPQQTMEPSPKTYTTDNHLKNIIDDLEYRNKRLKLEIEELEAKYKKIKEERDQLDFDNRLFEERKTIELAGLASSQKSGFDGIVDVISKPEMAPLMAAILGKIMDKGTPQSLTGSEMIPQGTPEEKRKQLIYLVQQLAIIEPKQKFEQLLSMILAFCQTNEYNNWIEYVLAEIEKSEKQKAVIINNPQ